MKFHLLSILLLILIVSCQESRVKKIVETKAKTTVSINKRPSITYINKQYRELGKAAANRYNNKLKEGVEYSYKMELFNTIDDSLSGLNNQCVKWKVIKTDLKCNRYDSLLIEKFESEVTDSTIKLQLKKSLTQCQKNRLLLNQPLHPNFAKALLKDTCGQDLTVGELMDDFKGKVVFLDFWSYGCGPCIASMPYAKKLKKELKGLPIEFVYFNTSKYSENNILRTFRLSQTKDNHYFLKRGLNNSIYKYMDVSWVPFYLIFDKKGCLVDMEQARPSEYGNRLLQEKLTELALETE